MDSRAPAHSETRRASNRGSWLVFILCAAAMCALRARAFDLPLETDESNYAYIGGRLLAGDRLYVDVWDHQPPGVFGLFATAQWAFGSSPIVFRLMALAASLVSLALVERIARRAGGATAGVVACVLFALASSDPGTAGEGCNRELFMTPLILGAWALMLSPKRCGATLLATGTFLGAASLLKTVVAAHWLVAALWIIAFGDRLSLESASQCNRPALGATAPSAVPRERGLIRRLLLFSAGPAVLWAMTLAWFAASNRGSEFIDAVFRFNLGYSAASEPVFARFAQFFQPKRHPFLFNSAAAVWCGGAVGLVHLAIRAIRSRRAGMIDAISADVRAASLAVIGLAVGGYVAVCLPVRFWPHYYYLMIAPLAIAAALVTTTAASSIAIYTGVTPRVSAAAARLVLLFLPAWLAWTVTRDYVLQSPLGITVHRYNTRDFWAQAQGLKVRSVTDPNDTVLVFGNDAGVYYYSGRRCASRYTMTTALDPSNADAPRHQRAFVEDVMRNAPRLILITDAKVFPEWVRFVSENYEWVGMDHNDLKPDEVILKVFADRRRPVRAIDWEWDRSALSTPADARPPE